MRRSWMRLGLLAAVLVAVVLIVAGRGDVVAAVALDVAEEGTLLVFACETCGEQLVLLRKGTDVPPRHCAEKMVLRRIPTPSSDPDPRFN
jgi:hypothetical protein